MKIMISSVKLKLKRFSNRQEQMQQRPKQMQVDQRHLRQRHNQMQQRQKQMQVDQRHLRQIKRSQQTFTSLFIRKNQYFHEFPSISPILSHEFNLFSATFCKILLLTTNVNHFHISTFLVYFIFFILTRTEIN